MPFRFIAEFTAVLMYCVAFAFAFIGGWLYLYAFKRMKKSKIILSLSLMMFAIATDSFFWFYTEFHRFIEGVYPHLLINPITLIIVKGILVVTVINFILCSIREDQREIINGSQKKFM